MFDYSAAVSALTLVLDDPFVLVALALSFSIRRHKAIINVASIASLWISAEKTAHYSLARILDTFSSLNMIIVITFGAFSFTCALQAVF